VAKPIAHRREHPEELTLRPDLSDVTSTSKAQTDPLQPARQRVKFTDDGGKCGNPGRDARCHCFRWWSKHRIVSNRDLQRLFKDFEQLESGGAPFTKVRDWVWRDRPKS